MIHSTIAYPTAETLRLRSRGTMPHWELDQGVYFITFRLADSLPRAVAERLRDQRRRLMQIAGRPRDVLNRAAVNVQLMKEFNLELDRGDGACHLRDRRAAALVEQVVRFRDGERHRLLAWSVMPNHVHVVFQLLCGDQLGSLMHSWKSYSANQVNTLLGRTGRFWQPEYFDHVVRHERELRRVVEYTVENPRSAGIEEWPYAGVTPLYVASFV
jgi:menaquinone-specific isochorismate synthase